MEQKAVNPITNNEENLNQWQQIVLAMLKKAKAGGVREVEWLIDNVQAAMFKKVQI